MANDVAIVMNAPSVNELLNAYVNGVFPMADPDGSIYWYSPNLRAVIPIYEFKPSRSLRPYINQKRFEVKINADFEGTMRECAKPRIDANDTWISEELIDSYTALHKKGFAHSIETYQEGKLVGGLYGVAIGAAFFGESMFHTSSNASKVAFYYLIEILKKRNYQLLDSQFINDNVARYGAIEIPKATYEQELIEAVKERIVFTNERRPYEIEELLSEEVRQF
ncbi:leucyl/phenylalanyl-tRNA--protein transferase [Spirosomataceae bacterium TFI 002]|nr:leucyl/phenylalanyl-tRNA--protein transferase [Spirosomataceae bacterium TFI 002]